MTRVLITGATGFVGRQLCESLSHQGYEVRAALRTDQNRSDYAAEHVVVGEIGDLTEWGAALNFDGPFCEPARAFFIENAFSGPLLEADPVPAFTPRK